MKDMLLVSDTPMFLMNARRKILGANPSLQKLLEAQLGSSQARLSFGADLDVIIDDLATGRTRIARAVCDLFARNRQLRVYVTIVLLSTLEGERTLLCALASASHDQQLPALSSDANPVGREPPSVHVAAHGA